MRTLQEYSHVSCNDTLCLGWKFTFIPQRFLSSWWLCTCKRTDCEWLMLWKVAFAFDLYHFILMHVSESDPYWDTITAFFHLIQAKLIRGSSVRVRNSDNRAGTAEQWMGCWNICRIKLWLFQWNPSCSGMWTWQKLAFHLCSRQ